MILSKIKIFIKNIINKYILKNKRHDTINDTCVENNKEKIEGKSSYIMKKLPRINYIYNYTIIKEPSFIYGKYVFTYRHNNFIRGISQSIKVK